MASTTRKRKGQEGLEEATKRLRIDKPSLSAPFEDDDDEDDYKSEANVDSDGEEGADTPITPFSPSRKKFPSELKTIKCTYEGCAKTFNRPARLTAHLRTHTNERPFVCTYEGCGKTYFEDKHLQQHIKGSHTHERSFHCDWEGCCKSFLTSTRLNRHKDTHVGHERFRCTAYPPCNQTFRKHQTLQRHIRSDHLDLAPFPCTFVDPVTGEQCTSGFDGSTGLRQHVNRIHGPAPAQSSCPDCDAPGFKTEKQLHAHMRKEHSDCMFCGLKFTSQQGLVKHIESQHSGSTLDERKNVVCPHDGCGKRFTKQNNLNTHIRSAHMGERYICGSFNVSDDQELVSFDDREGCGKDFVQKVTLVDHIRTAHLGLPSVVKRKKTTKNENDYMDDDFIDDEDDEGYNQPRQSKRNLRKPKVSKVDQLLGLSYTADPKRNIPCHDPTCPHKFIREYDRQVHMQSVHPFFQAFDSTGPAFDHASQTTPAESGISGSVEPLHPDTYDQADIDWELQRQALEGGPFWVGGDGEASAFQDRNEEWTQEQLEMRRLIG